MKFETVLNAFACAYAAAECPAGHKQERRRRQAAKFHGWLLVHAAKPYRPKRLEWKRRVNSSCYEAYSPVGRYEIWRGMNGYSCYFLPIPGESTLIAESIDSRDVAMDVVQAHFDAIWREMTEWHHDM